MSNIINLTPHAVTVIVEGQGTREFPKSGTIARVSETATSTGDVAGIPKFSKSFGEVTGVPEPTPDTFYIVSGLVAAALPNRKDLLVPHGLVRDDKGNIIGCQGFSHN